MLARIAFGSILLSTALAFGSASSSLMDISSDGKLLACSNRDSGTVTIVDLATHEKLREIAVGKTPEGLTFLGDSHKLACAIYAAVLWTAQQLRASRPENAP